MSHPICLSPGRRQLFLDDYLIESTMGIRRTFHAAIKDPRNPVLVGDQPWENGEALLFGSVLREPGGLWRMWYMNHFHTAEPRTRDNRAFCGAYAESSDGIVWRKPRVGAKAANGKRTNWVLGAHTHEEFREFHGVIRDDNDPDPARRYKTVFHTIPATSDSGRKRRYFSACSSDGIDWLDVRRISAPPPTFPDIGQFTYDPVEQEYVFWARAKYAPHAVRRRAPKRWFGRAVALHTSRDFVHWKHHGVVMAPDLNDPPAMDIYSLAGFRCGDLWVGLVQAYYQFPDNHALDIQLACSRDGRHWTRLADRKPVLPLGEIGEWDRFNQSVASGPVEAGDELRLYYGGRTYRHSGYSGADDGPRWAGVGLARWRLDGLASLDASFDGGVVLTKPLALSGNALTLNVKADHGGVMVEALNLDGTIAGVSLPVSLDSVRAKVKWGKPPPFAANRVVRLRFTLRNAQIYGFHCSAR